MQSKHRTVRTVTVLALCVVVFWIAVSSDRSAGVLGLLVVLAVAVAWHLGWATGRLTSDVAGRRRTTDRLGDDLAEAGRCAATYAAVHRLLADDGITIAFQPILSLATDRVVGVEALSRFPGPGGPQDWFDRATAVGLGRELEARAAEAALEAARSLPADVYVAVNLSPASLTWPGLAELLLGGPIEPSRIVVELTEHSRVGDYDRLAVALRPLREAGIRLAVDDAGAGYASFRHILCLSPDVIKLDRSLISGIDDDQARRALAAAVVLLAREMGATVVAEGIERTGELAVVRSLGVDGGQGCLLGRPTTDPGEWPTGRGPATPPAVAVRVPRWST